MRKILYTLVVGVYLLLSSGMVLQLHYCMDRLASVGLYYSPDRVACTDCGMQMNEDNDCCHDRTDVVKLVLDQTNAPAPIILLKPVLMTPTPDWSLVGSDIHVPQIEDRPVPAYQLSAKQRYRYRLLEVFRI